MPRDQGDAVTDLRQQMAEIRRYMLDNNRALGRIESLAAATCEDIKEIKKSNNDNHDSFNNRIGKLENDKHWQKGVAATIAVFASYLFNLFKI